MQAPQKPAMVHSGRVPHVPPGGPHGRHPLRPAGPLLRGAPFPAPDVRCLRVGRDRGHARRRACAPTRSCEGQKAPKECGVQRVWLRGRGPLLQARRAVLLGDLPGEEAQEALPGARHRWLPRRFFGIDLRQPHHPGLHHQHGHAWWLLLDDGQGRVLRVFSELRRMHKGHGLSDEPASWGPCGMRCLRELQRRSG
jgi:hypothetical protein